MSEIEAFGDSVLKGIILKDDRYAVSENRFTNLIEKYTSVRINNHAHMGHTIVKLEESLERSRNSLSLPENRIVLLEYGGNDCDFDWKRISETPEGEHFSRTELHDFNRLYIKNIEYLKSIGKEVYLLTLPPIDPQKYIKWVSKDKNGENIMQWLQGDINFLKDWHEMFNLEVLKIAQASAVNILDISSVFFEKKRLNHKFCGI